MNKRFFLTVIICCILLSQTVKAQDPITTLQHAGVTSVFYGTTAFSDAYTASAKGDTLYLSSDGFTPPATIAKKLTIIGTGHFPDSASVKIRTTILGGLTINAGADSLHLEGLYINGDINYADGSSINHVSVLRCRTGNIIFNSNSATASKNNCSYDECFIAGSINFYSYGDKFLIRHSVVNGAIWNINSNAVIDGNVLLSNGINYPPMGLSFVLASINSSLFKNNIIVGTTNYLFARSSANTYSNNLFVRTSATEIESANNYGSNNYFGVTQANIFVNQTGNEFDYSQDYHLKNPEKYIGTDGTQVGLYGGVLPFKDRGVPSNPQITAKSVDTKTDANGNLKINFTVKAQDN